eukprot:8228640-Karenia_brevis.AAC.1
MFTDPNWLSQLHEAPIPKSSTREPPRSPPADTVEPPAAETAEPSRGPFQVAGPVPPNHPPPGHSP